MKRYGEIIEYSNNRIIESKEAEASWRAGVGEDFNAKNAKGKNAKDAKGNNPTADATLRSSRSSLCGLCVENSPLRASETPCEVKTKTIYGFDGTAHAANDRAVLAAYGLKPDTPEPEIVAHLFRLYAEKVEKLKGGKVEKCEKISA